LRGKLKSGQFFILTDQGASIQDWPLTNQLEPGEKDKVFCDEVTGNEVIGAEAGADADADADADAGAGAGAKTAAKGAVAWETDAVEDPICIKPAKDKAG
jgi:hypothetical protein